MSAHRTSIDWRHTPHLSEASTYSRNHVATLSGGQTVVVSASTEFKGDANAADPEQLLLTALASCQMLTFLAVAEARGYRVERYRDQPVAYLEKNAEGRLAVTRIELSPMVDFAGDKWPDGATLEKLHQSAHRNCFIAHSITAQVTVTPVMETA